MKREPRYWNDDWSIATGPQILESIGEYVRVSEVANILKRDVYFLARLPYLSNLCATEIHSYMYGRAEDIPVYYHNNWVDLHRDQGKLAEYSLMFDEVRIVNDSGVDEALDVSWLRSQDKATSNQMKYLRYLINDPVVLDVERIRVKTLLIESDISKKRLSRLIQYFVGIKVPKSTGGSEYQVKGVIQKRRGR